MVDISTIQTTFSTLIGWRESPDTEMPKLTTELKTSTSGLYYNDAHPLLSIENIESISPSFDSMAFSVWSSLTTYSAGDYVRYNGVAYISLLNTNLNKTPSSQPTYWTQLVATYIDQVAKASIMNMVYRVINEKQLHNANKSLLDDVRLFDGEGRVTSTVVGQGRFVGFEFRAKSYLGLKASIRRIGAQFTLTQSNVPIYLYHSSQKAAVATYTLTTTKQYSTEWFAPTSFDMAFCKYAVNDAGGAWYLGYFEDDISGQAITREIDFLTAPCGTCFKDAYNRYSYELRNRYFSFAPVYFPSAALNGNDLPDMDQAVYSATDNWGLNIAMTVTCDLTDFFVDNKSLFTRALWKQVALDLIKAMAFTTRMDGLAQKVRSDAYMEINGDPQRNYKTGLEHELDKEYDAINFSLSDLNSPCFSQPQNKGIKIRGI